MLFYSYFKTLVGKEVRSSSSVQTHVAAATAHQQWQSSNSTAAVSKTRRLQTSYSQQRRSCAEYACLLALL
jgi:hypothetical protein